MHHTGDDQLNLLGPKDFSIPLAASMASDVASQGGGAGPGRDRHRRASSAVRAGWRGGPSPGTASCHRGEARKPRAAGQRRPQLKGKGVLIRGSSGNFIGGFRAHLQPGNRWEGLHRLGASFLNGLVSRGPQPGHSRPSYVKITRLGRGRLGYPRELGPERIGAATDTRGRQGPGGRSDHRAIVGN
jgi:hypothetical protein